ncbi:MAG: outer membrane beta-barrel protein [Acidobacteriota bacterium]|nr:outer membrane beta-barrel protein [Acidobacteriota bacterium]
MGLGTAARMLEGLSWRWWRTMLALWRKSYLLLLILGWGVVSAGPAAGQSIHCEDALRDGDDVVLEVGMSCPDGTGPTDFTFRPVDQPLGGSPGGAPGSTWYPVEDVKSASGSAYSQRGVIVIPSMVSPERVESACEAGERFLSEICEVYARCERADPFAVYETRLEVGARVELDCDKQYTTDGIHDPSILVDPGPGSGPPIPPSVGIFTSFNLDDAVVDQEALFGIRFGFGLSSRSSVEAVAAVGQGKRSGDPFNGDPSSGDFGGDEQPAAEGDVVTADLLWVRRWGRTENRFRGFFFAGPGWRFEGGDLDSDTFAPSAGLGVEIPFSDRWYLDARIAGRWLENRPEDQWVTEAQVGVSYRFGP